MRSTSSSNLAYLAVVAGNLIANVNTPFWNDQYTGSSASAGIVVLNGNMFSGPTQMKIYVGNRLSVTGNLIRGSGTIIDWQNNTSGSVYASNLELTPPTHRAIGAGGIKSGTTNTATGMYENLVPAIDSSISLGTTTARVIAVYAGKETEIDFGATPTFGKSFTITDANCTTLARIVAVQSGAAATGRQADENEMDQLVFSALPGTGSFVLNAATDKATGPVSGKYKVNYVLT
jgi:hypothetical protein